MPSWSTVDWVSTKQSLLILKGNLLLFYYVFSIWVQILGSFTLTCTLLSIKAVNDFCLVPKLNVVWPCRTWNQFCTITGDLMSTNFVSVLTNALCLGWIFLNSFKIGCFFFSNRINVYMWHICVSYLLTFYRVFFYNG